MSSQSMHKLFERALRKAVHRQVSNTDKRTRLEAIADKATALAMEGETSMINLIADRLDGKARQQLELEISNRMTIVIGQGDHSVPVTTVDAVPILDVDQDGTVPALASRGINTETEPLPPPEPYSPQKPLAEQRLAHTGHLRDVDSGDSEAEQQRIASARSRLTAIRARLGTDSVQSGGGEDEDA